MMFETLLCCLYCRFGGGQTGKNSVNGALLEEVSAFGECVSAAAVGENTVSDIRACQNHALTKLTISSRYACKGCSMYESRLYTIFRREYVFGN